MYMHVDINGAYAAFECAMDPKLSKSAGVKSFAQIKKDLKPYMGQ